MASLDPVHRDAEEPGKALGLDRVRELLEVPPKGLRAHVDAEHRLDRGAHAALPGLGRPHRGEKVPDESVLRGLLEREAEAFVLDRRASDAVGATDRRARAPGHARHHHCIWDPVTQGWFTGDTFGLSYREFDTEKGAWIVPTSTPVQFEPEALQASIARLLAKAPRCMYLTHYGRVDDVPRLGALLQGLLAEMVALGESQRGQADAAVRHAALKQGQLGIFSRSLRAHGVAFDEARIAELLAIDLELNAQGMAVWLDRPARA